MGINMSKPNLDAHIEHYLKVLQTKGLNQLSPIALDRLEWEKMTCFARGSSGAFGHLPALEAIALGIDQGLESVHLSSEFIPWDLKDFIAHQLVHHMMKLSLRATTDFVVKINYREVTSNQKELSYNVPQYDAEVLCRAQEHLLSALTDDPKAVLSDKPNELSSYSMMCFVQLSLIDFNIPDFVTGAVKFYKKELAEPLPTKNRFFSSGHSSDEDEPVSVRLVLRAGGSSVSD